MRAMITEISLQLAGQVGRWRPRRVDDQARMVWSTWLRARRHGTIGIYVLAKPHAPLELAEALLSNTWVRVRGLLSPLRVLASGDDPRTPEDSRCAPLLVHAVAITHVRRRDPAPPLLDEPPLLQVRAGGRPAAGALAPAAHLPDLYHLAGDDQSGTMRRWSALRGIVAELGAYRYLRYIVAEERA